MNLDEQLMDVRKQRLLDVMNEIFNVAPIPLENLNRIFCFSDSTVLEKLVDIEKRYPEVVLHVKRGDGPVEGLVVRDGRGELTIDGISIASLVAMMTDVLCGEQLRFSISEDGMITGVHWYNYRA